jgi:cell pole-organizing protein PopZ
MEEILASIRRIISEDSQTPGSGSPSAGTRDSASSTDRPELSRGPAHPADDGDTAPLLAPQYSSDGGSDSGSESPGSWPSDAHAEGAPDDDSPEPLDLTVVAPPELGQPGSPIGDARGTGRDDGVLDLTNEVRETPAQSPSRQAGAPERPTFLSRETYSRQLQETAGVAAPESVRDSFDSRIETAAATHERPSVVAAPQSVLEERQVAEEPLWPSVRLEPLGDHRIDDYEGRLVSPGTESAAASALARLRQATERQREVPARLTEAQLAEIVREQVLPMLDDKLAPALKEALEPILEDRLPGLIRERVEPLLAERADPVMRDELGSALGQRLDPYLEEHLGPAIRERLDPALRERLEPLLRERLDPMLRDWFDRNLPEIVERVVEREIERIVRQPGGN